MPKIIKNGKEYSGVPIEVVTAWAPTADPVQVKEPLMGNTDISTIGDGTVTGAIGTIKNGLNYVDVSNNITSTYGTFVVKSAITLLGIAIINFELTTTQQINPGTNVITGIPRVKGTYINFFGASTGTPFPLYTSGTAISANASLASGKQLTGTLTYVID